jgi:WD40 repeat protein
MMSDTKADFIQFHSEKDNKLKIQNSYDINQITNQAGIGLLSIKCNNNIKNEFAVINSNFQVNYFVIGDDGVYNVCNFSEHTDRVNDITFFKNCNSPFDKAFMTGSSDGTIKLWDSRMQNSAKTISANKAIVNSLDTNCNVLAAGFGLDVGIWDLVKMKNTYRYKYGHSDLVTSVKLRDNQLISGGEDYLVNTYDITNGLNMTSGVSCVNTTQGISKVDFLDNEMNFIQTLTNVFTFNIIDMFKGYSIYEFDAKEVYISNFRNYIILTIRLIRSIREMRRV